MRYNALDIAFVGYEEICLDMFSVSLSRFLFMNMTNMIDDPVIYVGTLFILVRVHSSILR